MYEVFEHTADLGIRIRANDLNELFADAGRGLIAQLANLSTVRPVNEKTITLTGESLDYLLFDWLSELLYAFEESHLLLAEFDVQVESSAAGFSLAATCHGETADTNRHELDHEVKAITYHGLFVKQQGDSSWEAEVIVDI
jgi:SHS2 domain-containing protein